MFVGDAHGNVLSWMGEDKTAVGEERESVWVPERVNRVIAVVGTNDGTNEGKGPCDAPAESLPERCGGVWLLIMTRL
jgi:hypothetical protein